MNFAYMKDVKHLVWYVLFMALVGKFSAQSNGSFQLAGMWQGVLLKDGQKESDFNAIYLNLRLENRVVSGKSREEVAGSELFAIYTLKGQVTGNEVTLSQGIQEKKSLSSKVTWCAFQATLRYTDSTGYLEGSFSSTACKRHTGKIVLYRSKQAFSEGEGVLLSHQWREVFLRDLKKGLKAPEIRERERNSFVFQPIYFDYDKFDLKPEYHSFLLKMVRVVNSHSDLRIKVTGHTDADGSDAYNEELSKKRATVILQFFLLNGLTTDQVIIDFRGEKEPVDNNQTPEGKQRNRRVDFSFI